MFKRLKIYLRRTDRIELGQQTADLCTRNNEDLREWLKQFGSIKIFHEFGKQYDFAIEKIQIQYDQIFHKVKLVFKTKNNDEGYFGGCTTLRYENERIREERKIELQKKMKMKRE